MCNSYAPTMDQQQNNAQQQMYSPLVPSMPEIVSSAMYGAYNPTGYGLPGDVNGYFNAGANVFGGPTYAHHPLHHHHHQMSQMSQMSQTAPNPATTSSHLYASAPRSPSYSYASSASSSPRSGSGSPTEPSVYPSPSQLSPAASPYVHHQAHAAYPKVFVDAPTSSVVLSAANANGSGGRRLARCGCSFCATGRDVKNNKGQRLHACDWAGCGKIYPKTSHLKAHIRTHTNNRPFVCRWENCFKSFSRSDELNRHARIHSGVKTHVCQSCGKGFTRSDHLQKHKKTHENQKRRKSKKEAASAFHAVPAAVPAMPAAVEVQKQESASEVPPPSQTASFGLPPQLPQAQHEQQQQQYGVPAVHHPNPEGQSYFQQQQPQQQPQPQHQQQSPLMQLQLTCVTYPNNFYHY